MENPPLPNVQLKNSALSFVLENTLIKSIVDKIKLIPQFDQLKNDIEITEHVCNSKNTSLNKSIKVCEKLFYFHSIMNDPQSLL